MTRADGREYIGTMSSEGYAKRNYFGTDGIRGVYGEDLTDGLAMLAGGGLGRASGAGFVVMGRDNRLSGEVLARALTEGALAAGTDVLDLGVVTTPCVACVAKELGGAGVMISASHNPPEYNGLKFFGRDGGKLSREAELVIEEHIARGRITYAEQRGKLLPGEDGREIYARKVMSAGSLKGLRIVVDCANGAASGLAPELLSRMGAEVVAVGTSRDGALINRGVGALFPEVVADAVRRYGADMGFAFDGDADRVIAADEKGGIVDGDRMIFALACLLSSRGELPDGTVVGTLHTNMGAEKALADKGISLVRTDIGDHNVARVMRENGYALGGEQSGHIIIGSYLPTGDGLLAGAVLARAVAESGTPLSVLTACETYPQVNADIRTRDKAALLADPALAAEVRAVEGMLSPGGRVMLRASGTEDKIRIMAESRDPFLAAFAARTIELFIRRNMTD